MWESHHLFLHLCHQSPCTRSHCCMAWSVCNNMSQTNFVNLMENKVAKTYHRYIFSNILYTRIFGRWCRLCQNQFVSGLRWKGLSGPAATATLLLWRSPRFLLGKPPLSPNVEFLKISRIDLSRATECFPHISFQDFFHAEVEKVITSPTLQPTLSPLSVLQISPRLMAFET